MPEATIDLSKAHDVRHLHMCGYCGGVGDDRYMPVVDGEMIHGFCAKKTLGLNGLLDLPRSELAKITLREVGPRVMKRICDKF